MPTANLPSAGWLWGMMAKSHHCMHNNEDWISARGVEREDC
jgi:hypothetical protein